MLIYKAMYKFLGQGVHAEVLDFPGVISWGPDLHMARRLLSSALVDMAELNLERGEPLPQANAAATDPDFDLEEPIYLLLQAVSLGESREFPFSVDDTGSDSDLLDRDLGVGPVK